jgi:Uma2 family endonuclease
MLHAKASLITRSDYEGMPEGPPYFQVIEGDLVMSPSPKFLHQHIAGNLFAQIHPYLEQNPIGTVVMAPLDVFLSEINVYQPDLVFVCNDRAHLIADEGIEGAPDLVVEVLSTSTAKFDKGPKRKIYSRTGVREMWIIDPDARTIQVFDFARDIDLPVVTHSANAVFKTPLLPGLKIDARKVFKEPARKTRK